jgi:hypothetical protein
MDTNIISKYNKKQTIAVSVLVAMFFVLVPYGEAKIECKNFYRDGREQPVDDETCQTVGYNEIAGRAFPNGTIIKKKTNPKVYYIENFQKRAIESPALFESHGFDWRSLIIASEADVDQIPNGENLKFRDGSLLSNRGTVYIISNGLRRPIASPAAFLRLGFKWSNIKAVSDAEINLHPLGEIVTTTSNYPDGVVIKTGSGKMYLVEDDKRRYIPSPLVFESRFKWNETVDLSLAVAPVYNPNPKGDVIIRDGVLISGEGKVWVTENGKKVPIYSPEIFESLGLNWGQIKVASSFDMANIPTNNLSNIGKNVKVPNDFTAVKSSNSSQIYVFRGGVLRPIQMNEFNKMYTSLDQVITMPDRVIKQYPVGSNVPPASSGN